MEINRKQQEIFNLIKEITGQANILTIPRIFIDYTQNLSSALLLSQLLYWTDKTADGWIFKTYATWKEEIGLSEYETRTAAKNLKKMDVLETKIKKAKGNPTVHYKIKRDVLSVSILKFLKERTQKNLRKEPLNIQETYNKDYNKDYKISLSDLTGSDNKIDEKDNPSNGTNKPSTQERNKEYLPLVNKLAEIIRSNKNIKISHVKIKSWSNEIRKIIESDGIEYERIDAALNWYRKNIGGDYVPVIESGTSLRNKFLKLENAIERDDNPPFKQTKSLPKKKDPDKIFEREAKKNPTVKNLKKRCFEAAKQLLINTSNGELPKLAENLIDLREYIEKQQDKHRYKYDEIEQNGILMYPNQLIEYYIDWIGDNHWIEDKEPRLFTPKHKLFRKFLQYQKRLQNDRHPLTGE